MHMICVYMYMHKKERLKLSRSVWEGFVRDSAASKHEPGA